MKKYLSLLLIPILLFSCKKDPDPTVTTKYIIPSYFYVPLNSALSFPLISGKDADIKKVPGNRYYDEARQAIFTGEMAAQMVNDLIIGIRKQKFESAVNLTVKGDKDNRNKTIVVTPNAFAENAIWNYSMVITDQDGGIGLQMYWNKSDVSANGFAIVNFHYIDTTNKAFTGSEIYRVDYTQGTGNGYEATMVITISGKPVNAANNISSLKMFAGVYGDTVVVYGNATQPNYKIAPESQVTGRSFSFTAKGDYNLNNAAIKLGLPPLTLEDKNQIFPDYLLENVINEELIAAGANDSIKANALKFTRTPAFYTKDGFYSVVTAPDSLGFTSSFENLSGFTPYSPKEVSDLKVEFIK